MRHEVILSVVVAVLLASACGGMGERRDSGPAPGDAVAPVSPFVPVAIENVIDSLVNAITQKNCSAVPACCRRFRTSSSS
jgi:hypothetical protein